MKAPGRLVFLGPVAAPPTYLDLPEILLHEGQMLSPGNVLPLERKRSPWNPARDVERVIVGSHGARADVLLLGRGIHPEHVRVYIPRSAAGAEGSGYFEEGTAPGADLLVIHPGSTHIDGRLMEPRDFARLAGGETIELGPWRFRYEAPSFR